MQARTAVFAKVGNSGSQVMKEILTKRSSTTEVNAQGYKTGASVKIIKVTRIEQKMKDLRV